MGRAIERHDPWTITPPMIKSVFAQTELEMLGKRNYAFVSGLGYLSTIAP
jgi:hypothetical protein